MSQQKKTILLGLDNTIMQCFKKSKPKFNELVFDLASPYDDIGIIKRPYLDIFLAMVHKHFEIHVYLLLDILFFR